MSFRKNEIPGFFQEPPTLSIEFEGKRLAARRNEPLALTLLANGYYVVGRSAKYHRPRGVFCGRGTCGSCAAQIDNLPNTRSCQATAHEGATIDSPHVLGSAQHDLLGTVDWLFPTRMDHHSFMTASSTLNRVAVAMARQLAGLGKLPEQSVAPVAAEPEVKKVDVAIVGAGHAGLAALEILGDAGVTVLALDADTPEENDQLVRARVIGFYDDKTLVGVAAGQQLRVQPRAMILANGAIELRPRCVGNDLPGIFSRRAVARMLNLGVRPGAQAAVVVDETIDPDTRQLADVIIADLAKAGVEIVAVVGHKTSAAVKATSSGPLAAVDGTTRVRRVRVGTDARELECDCVVWCSRAVPDYTLARQIGLDTPFDLEVGGFVPKCDKRGITAKPGVFLAGELSGISQIKAGDHGKDVARAVLQSRSWS
jgi:sarcosine oxidase, subunit alpha